MSFTPGNSTTHDLGARQISPFTVAGILVDAVKLVDKLIKILDGDKSARGEYTKSLVTGVRTCYPYFNVVVCHEQHDFKWDGVEGKDWLHQHKEFDIKAGGAIQMSIARSGTFRNHGDGGYLNWAYGGNIIATGVDGANVQFGPYATQRRKRSTAK
ncbi:hypothetical protein BD779DRAFT_1678038 [Infundibulicybe gibba]|nr:hypothetical protein BD779DRAFT_1678038 [Infundibulicybe gibba]